MLDFFIYFNNRTTKNITIYLNISSAPYKPPSFSPQISKLAWSNSKLALVRFTFLCYKAIKIYQVTIELTQRTWKLLYSDVEYIDNKHLFTSSAICSGTKMSLTLSLKHLAQYLRTMLVIYVKNHSVYFNIYMFTLLCFLSLQRLLKSVDIQQIKCWSLMNVIPS